MGMAVKGAAQHRLVRRAMDALVRQEKGRMSPEDYADVRRLQDRADMALERISRRKRQRAERHQLG